MSLDVSAKHLQNEWREADEKSKRYLGTTYEEDIKSYANSAYRQGWSRTGDQKENFAYEWISVFAPQFLGGIPRVKTKTRRQGPSADIAKALQHALNRSIVETRFWNTAEKIFYDWAFRMGVAITTPEPMPGMVDFEDPPYRPVSKRISPLHYRHDPLAMEATEDRWRGHMVIRDKSDLLKEAKDSPELGWNEALIQSLGSDVKLDEAGRDRRVNVKRDEVVVVEIWVPEHRLKEAKDSDGQTFTPKPEDGFHGTIFTLALDIDEGDDVEDRAAYLRPPRPFYGPRSGPYTVSGAFVVPDQTEPLSPIVAVRPQTIELNAHRDATSRAMRNHKKLLLIDATAGDDVPDIIKDGEDQAVFKIENAEEIDKHVKEIELWGVSQQHLAHLELTKQTLRTLAGIDESMVGNAVGDVTATATSLANQSAARRASYMLQKWVMFLEEILRKEAWYLDNDERIVVPLGEEAAMSLMDPETGQPVVQPVFQGGGDPIGDNEIEIDVYSVQHTSEQLELMHSQEEIQLMTSVIPMLPQIALFYDVEDWAERQGERLGDPNFGKRINVQALQTIGMIQLQGMVQPTPNSQPPQPRLAKDIMPASKRPEGYSGNARHGASNNSNVDKKSGTMRVA